MPEKTTKWVMVTLIAQKGNEGDAKEMLREIEKETAQNGMEIVFWDRGRPEHYHILGKRDSMGKLSLEKWHGTVKWHDITESQARVVKQNHTIYHSAREGLRQEGHNSTVISS